MATDTDIAKQVIQDELEAQINTAKAELEVLAGRAEGKMVKAEVEAYETLMPKAQAIQQKLQELKKSTGAQWQQTKADLEELISDFKESAKPVASAAKGRKALVNFHNQPRFFLLMVMFASLTSVLVRAQSADDHDRKVREAAAQSVKAGQVFDAVMKTPDKAIPEDLLAHAKAIAVFPQVIKAAFFVGGEGGRGVVSRRTRTGWGDPVFFRAGGGSVGPQVGASSTDIVLLFMNDEAVGGLMKDKFELGGEAAVAAGPIGRNASAGTDGLMQAEILSYSRSRGLFAGVNLKGVVIRPEDDLNLAVYDKSARELLDRDERRPEDATADIPSFSKTVSRYTMKAETKQ